MSSAKMIVGFIAGEVEMYWPIDLLKMFTPAASEVVFAREEQC